MKWFISVVFFGALLLTLLATIVAEIFRDKNTIIVNFTGAYGNPVQLNSGDRAHFERATQPFCVKNRNGEEVCGEAGSNPNLHPGPQNMSLWFRSTNGKTGRVELVKF